MIAVFLFYDKTYGMCDKFTFSKDLKHCNVITYDGRGYVITTIDKAGITSRIIRIDNLSKFLKRLPCRIPELSSIICTFISGRRSKKWFPLGLNICNEISRKVSGIDVPITFNAASLYHYLMWFKGKRNYEIDYTWRRK